ncbi:UDP-2,3-diacylglucosamine diphosphatase [Membranihabitans maritimus]|uniref:UDP-2,3-diacylglucosamine diphosphatase n=1 Tax=Membranihabitans maritimus TaxID=2904244 RepID=UPI001F1EDA53|nr:UDP-2,3-diacylglucosamine diphosphatase [Membranihabitans maritimus]
MEKVYFASDFHLGIQNSKEREKKIISWLDKAAVDADKIYLLGDLFDYWFEYKFHVPKGYVRFLGKLAEIQDSGISIEIFTGNHDVWMFKYFPEEFGIPVHREVRLEELGAKKIMLGHGDGLGPGDMGYKRLKKVFTNPVLQFLYRQLHPDLSWRIANFWSHKSRSQELKPPPFLGKEKEWLIQYCEYKLQSFSDIDFFVFGHRHLPIFYQLSNERSYYINIGDWLNHNTYGMFDGNFFYLYEYGRDEPLYRSH